MSVQHQELVVVNGILRFKKNAIVRHLLDACGQNGIADMNSLAILPFSDEDRVQFAELIGYSLAGFEELSYVSDKTFRDAQKSKSGRKK